MTETPPWGTPSRTPAEPHRYEPPRPQPTGWTAPHGSPETVAAGYFLLVEQLTGSGESAIWRVEPMPIFAGTDREQARAAAYDLALSFRPKHPFSPSGRTVWRKDPDSLLVIVQGATKSFHFRVTVVERLA
jgi:hypothetical protein